jgi:glycosyltransferase involved in cell wall biosynthesis
MIRRVVLVTEIISPYRIPLFNALARQPDIDLHVIFLSETDPSLRQWQIYKDEIRFSYQVLRSWRKRAGRYNFLMNRGLMKALRESAPHAIICGGYNYIASWQCLFWSRSHQVPFLLWSESNQQDSRRGTPFVESLKRQFLSRCTAFVVPGQSARDYLQAQRVKNGTIFTAPNAVDNDLFAKACERARSRAEQLRVELNLPEHYFLFVGRLVPEKGVFDLLAAYAKLENPLREKIGLVFVGDGTCRIALEQQATAVSPGVIRFAGFRQRDDLASYYALAEALILPTHTDTWGLVVNEAMACGLPIIVTAVAGCAADLVKPAWNGFVVSPADVPSLTAGMTTLAAHPDLCRNMAANSRQHISRFTAEVWAKSINSAIDLARSVHE